LNKEASFSDFAALTIEHARQRYGADGAEVVQHAWSETGVIPTQEQS
jgi:Zn-dependent metalloprotease